MSLLLKFSNVYINESTTISGPKEHDGPLGKYFDFSFDSELANQNNYEQAEIEYVKTAISGLLKKLNIYNIDLYLGGDLSNQISTSNQVAMNLDKSFIGVYGACSTIILSLIIGSVFVDNSLVKNAVCFSSSNFGVSERQYRYPLNYGGQKKSTTTITTTGAISAYLSSTKSKIKVVRATIGKVIDVGWDNVNDMGSPMSYAAYSTIKEHFKNTLSSPTDYDLILTGDLSKVGSKILFDLFKKDGIQLINHVDAGALIYGNDKSFFSGGSGSACIGLVGFGYIKKMMENGNYKRVLFVGTGSLHSKTCIEQKGKIPVVAHLIELEVEDDIF